ncbi:MAG: hypothetical protein KME31_06565 [Tolypothrix carrinoi HA7290-LM1]|nr:hypothetical protein [Tolypothrix carrinoi HA7290-LM1]
MDFAWTLHGAIVAEITGLVSRSAVVGAVSSPKPATPQRHLLTAVETRPPQWLPHTPRDSGLGQLRS